MLRGRQIPPSPRLARRSGAAVAVAPGPAVRAAAPIAMTGPSRGLAITLAIYVMIMVARVHEAIPVLSKVYPAKLVLVPLLVFTVINWKRLQWNRVLANTAVRAMLVVIMFALLSIPGSYWPGGSVAFITQAFVQGVLVFFLVSACFAHRPTLHLAVTALAVGAVGAALLSFGAQLVLGRFEMGGTYDENETAAFFVTILPLLFMLAAEGGKLRLLGFIGIPLMLAGIVKTGSRGAIVSLALLTPFLLFYAPPRRRLTYAVMIVVGVTVFSMTASAELRSRMMTLFSQSDYNFTEREGRKAVWERGMGYMKDNPILGVGLNAFQYAEGATLQNEGFGIKFSAAHNSFIQVGAELGVIALAAFLVCIGSAFAGCRRVRRYVPKIPGIDPTLARREVGLATAGMGAIVGMATSGFFLSLAFSALFFFVLAFGVAVALGSPLARPAQVPYVPVNAWPPGAAARRNRSPTPVRRRFA